MTPTISEPRRDQRRLALAVAIERLIDQGAVKNYAEVARRLGVSRARVTAIVKVGHDGI
jgi:hypothetical protein